jgi:hypothetical protein
MLLFFWSKKNSGFPLPEQNNVLSLLHRMAAEPVEAAC